MTSTIISSIVLFLGVSILLVVILLVAKKYLVPSGKATITINNDKQIEVETGSSLLSTLSNEKYSCRRPAEAEAHVPNAVVRYWKAGEKFYRQNKYTSPGNNN